MARRVFFVDDSSGIVGLVLRRVLVEQAQQKAMVYIQQEQFEWAITELHLATRAFPENIYNYRLLGDLYMSRARDDNATRGVSQVRSFA